MSMWKSPEDRFSEAFDAAMDARTVAMVTIYPGCTIPQWEKAQEDYREAKRKLYGILKDSITTNARRDA